MSCLELWNENDRRHFRLDTYEYIEDRRKNGIFRCKLYRSEIKCKTFYRLNKENKIVGGSQYDCTKVHPSTLPDNQWNRKKVINELIKELREGFVKDSYNDYILDNPIKALDIYGFSDISNKLYRTHRKRYGNIACKNNSELCEFFQKYPGNWWYTQRQICSNLIQLNEETTNNDNSTFEITEIKENESNNDIQSQTIQSTINENEKKIAKLRKQNEHLKLKLKLNSIPTEYDMIFYQGGDSDLYQLFFTKRALELYVQKYSYCLK